MGKTHFYEVDWIDMGCDPDADRCDPDADCEACEYRGECLGNLPPEAFQEQATELPF